MFPYVGTGHINDLPGGKYRQMRDTLYAYVSFSQPELKRALAVIEDERNEALAEVTVQQFVQRLPAIVLPLLAIC